MQVYDFMNYKEYINYLIQSLPKKGRGQFLKISKVLRVHSTLISQVLRGEKHFTHEQAYEIASYFTLNELEKEYFLEMYQFNRAGSYDLQKYYQKRLDNLRNNSNEVSSRVKAKRTLNDQDLAIYYSDWAYMACWLLYGLDNVQSRSDIVSRLNLSAKRVNDICDFLLSVGLVKEVPSFSMGQAKTHIEREHPLVGKHHVNWRLKTIEYVDKIKDSDLVFSAPLSIAKKDFLKLKKDILALIENASQAVSESDPETIAFLNIDLIEI